MARLRAPELGGRGWLNTGGRSLALSELRGRFVLLDFWTFCCAKCATSVGTDFPRVIMFW